MSSLFSLGSNGSGQLGIGHEDDANTPSRVLWSDGSPLEYCRIKKISAGGNHTLILLDDGQLYWSGNNEDGRCFHQSLDKSNIMNAVRFDDLFDGYKVSLMACSWEASIAVLEDGRIFSSGTGNRGELGLGPGVTKSSVVQLLDDFASPGTRPVDLAASMNHCVAVMSDGEVYAWGAGRKGQIGQIAEDTWRPRKVFDIPFAVQRAVVGTNFSCLFGRFVASESHFLGQDKYSVLPIEASTVISSIDVVSSWGSLYFLLRSGKLISRGRNDHAQLSTSMLSTITAVAAGSEHAACITDAGEVFAWGWGEHGNCGPEVDAKSFDSHGSSLPISGKAIFVGAGCATTWICSQDNSP